MHPLVVMGCIAASQKQGPQPEPPSIFSFTKYDGGPYGPGIWPDEHGEYFFGYLGSGGTPDPALVRGQHVWNFGVQGNTASLVIAGTHASDYIGNISSTVLGTLNPANRANFRSGIDNRTQWVWNIASGTANAFRAYSGTITVQVDPP